MGRLQGRHGTPNAVRKVRVLHLPPILWYNKCMNVAHVNPRPLSNEEKRQFFLDNAETDFYTLGKKYRLDFETEARNTIITRASRIFNEVKKNPDNYGLAPDEVARVLSVRAYRLGPAFGAKHQANLQVGTHILPTSEKGTVDLDLKKIAFKDMVLHARTKALNLLHKKLDRIAEDDNIDAVRIVELTTAFGTIFDKTQIVTGEATENVAILAKIDKDMSPDDALLAVLAMREANQVEKEKAKNKI